MSKIMSKIMRIFVIALLCAAAVQAQTAKRFFAQGTRAAEHGRYEKALEKYQKSLAQYDPADDAANEFLARIHFNIGVCFYHMNQAKAALTAYEKALKLRAGNYPKAIHAVGMAHNALQNYPQAKTAFAEAVRLDQRDGESWFDLAIVLIREKDFDRAESAFREAVKNNSIAAAASHNNLGVIAALHHDWQTAEAEFAAALKTSNGKFLKAKMNLDFCRAWQQNQFLLAKLEFTFNTQTN